ncbi:AbiJ-related protein [Pontibacter lucknowensis]|uniref:ABC-type multidrug transport system, ATPase component n=1 Tax=Pontibacter lucknowensis TaxID=1077936 RepID=A0A1N6XBD4_9BACT|nr:AAA family ATPase [Pontibacter lucknowensis]SIQ99559.1 ABC-type multidrug transport system, ATPase component [Pontibacter lucknowensis]
MQLTKKVKSELLSFLLQTPNSFGELDENEGIIPFLGEIWNLRAMPSTDERFQDGYRDIYHHMINNDDWSLEYLFIDRLNLLEDDESFKKFTETIVSPKYKKNADEIFTFVASINRYLEKGNLQLAITAYTENNLPVYSLQTKEEVDDLPAHIKLNDYPFYVIKTPNGRSKYKSSHSNPPTTPAFVLVFNDGWNDFSVWSEFSLFYYNDGDTCEYIGDTKIIFKEELNTPEFIPEQFNRLNQDFCSLGQEISYYNNLQDSIERDFESVLYALRDAAFFPQIQEVFEEQGNFVNSLVRDDKAERLLREAKHIITSGNTSSDLYNFTYTFKPAFSDTPVNINFGFNVDSSTPNRIYGLIGKNGTGKTQLVASLPNKIAKREDAFFSPRAPLFSKVIAISYSIFDRFEIPQTTASFNYIYCGLRNKKGEFVSEDILVERFHKTWKRIEELKRINKWRKILLNFIDEELVNQFIVERDEIEFITNKYKVNISGFNSIKNILSSGQSILLYIISEIVAHIRYDSLLIYDEPETHLHPNAITQLMNTIYELVNEFESYCIIATHSPLVIRELFSRNVYVIERHGDIPSIRLIGIESFGENLTTLTDEVFGNKDVDKQYKMIIQKLVEKGASYDSIVSNLSSNDTPLSLNARLYIKSQIKVRNEKA